MDNTQALREAAEQALRFIKATNKTSSFWLVPESELNKTVTALDKALSQPPAPEQASGEWINDKNRLAWALWRIKDLESQLAATPTAEPAGEAGGIKTEHGIAWQASAAPQPCNLVMVDGRRWYRDDHPALSAFPAAPEAAKPTEFFWLVESFYTDGRPTGMYLTSLPYPNHQTPDVYKAWKLTVKGSAERQARLASALPGTEWRPVEHGFHTGRFSTEEEGEAYMHGWFEGQAATPTAEPAVEAVPDARTYCATQSPGWAVSRDWEAGWNACRSFVSASPAAPEAAKPDLFKDMGLDTLPNFPEVKK